MKKLPPAALKKIGCRVKCVPWMRKYGLRCLNNWNEANNRAFAGEHGRLEKETISGVDWEQLRLVARFGGGRRLVVGELETSDGRPIADEAKGEWRVGLTLGDDIEYLKFCDIPE